MKDNSIHLFLAGLMVAASVALLSYVFFLWQPPRPKGPDRLAESIEAVRDARLKLIDLSCGAECDLKDHELSQKYLGMSCDLGKVWLGLKDIKDLRDKPK